MTELTARRSNSLVTTVAESRKRCKSLGAFIREAWPLLLPEVPYVHGWHIDLIASHLEALTYGKFLAQGLDNRLMINIPPGFMKSLLLMVFWPAWEWGPCGLAHLQIVATSYRLPFCIRDQNRFIQLVTSGWFQERWPMGFKKVSEHKIENDRGGFRTITPFGSLVGGRGDRLLIDDPHSIDTSESELDRERAIRNFRERGVRSLNDPKKSIIAVIMQRLHMRDLCGVIEELGLKWTKVMLPMRFEVDRRCVTPFGKDPRRHEGELLFPEWYPLAEVDRDETAMTAYAISGQHQQRPHPRGGAIFRREWFESRIVDEQPKHLKLVRGWDFAATMTAGAAFTAGVMLGYEASTKRFYVCHVIRQRTENPEMLVKAQAHIDGNTVIQDIPQDPGQAGKVQARSIVAALAGFEAYASPESAAKEARALPFAAQAEVGNVYLVRGPWNNPYLDELETFPTGYKDQVDATSRAFSRFVLQPVSPVGTALFLNATRPLFGENHG